ncbi:DNA gyrase subunit A [Candidatus Marsarchaeota archaeon]|nr:DNA gyrase subunit A [Candidatus Marsarchaeota archaeon]MCL5092336.1 DNA gyrase subunit A [Candidatus Marsarchaeota archaeon]
MDNVIDVSIESEMQSSYIDYAMSVIVGRALPDARDGLKPAQRRILYAMYKLNNVHDQPTKKSARIVGEVIGKYHPHGDMAAYETLVRMAQDFSMNHMLVEGQGNMGSIDGDPPAAQRYTEVRLRAIAEEMLVDIEKKAVPFVPNFDNTEEEPVVLPSKIPNAIINGSSGIAVGVATNIVPHNLVEVCSAIIAYVDNRDITSEELLAFIKGPDFPTGGIVFYDSNLVRSYLTGRGSVIIRARSHIEDIDGHKGKRIVITEIPYTVNKATLIEKIATLVKDKALTGISALRDESDKRGIRIIVELKGDTSPEYILNLLYKHTQLQNSLPVMNIAVIGNRLLTLNIKNFIKIFVEHRFSVIKSRTEYDLGVASDRLHIVDGLLTAINDIDYVVSIIRKSSDSKEAKGALIAKYGFSEKQASAILEMRLSRLTSLESNTLRNEMNSLKQSIEYFKRILSDNNEIYKIIKEETKDVSNRYGRERRSTIESNIEMQDIESEDLIKDEESVIILTNTGYLKRLPADIYKSQQRGGKGVITIDLKEGDFVKQVATCMSKDYLLMVSNRGRAYWLKGYMIPTGNRYGMGKAAVNLVKLEENEEIEAVINTRVFENSFLNFVTRKGRIKRVRAKLFSRPRSSGIKAIPTYSDDMLADVCLSSGSDELFIASHLGKGTRFKETDIRSMGRNAYGVRGIRLKGDDYVVNVVSASKDSNIVSITENGFGKATEIMKYRLQKRGGKGVINVKCTEKTGSVVRVLAAEKDKSILIVNSKGLSIQFAIASIRVTGRNASGVRLMRIAPPIKVVDAQIV